MQKDHALGMHMEQGTEAERPCVVAVSAKAKQSCV